ncbi:hypothetical protein [Hyphomonas sp.]|uniref:hypothetical protein n=1 Tax=Hyphomonas sp. TaxID=87 RepID=UPI003D2E1878|tara:strand:- start:1908 stop:2786 length:879 start_codon:yes stop_codon:yes gene_type:complete
MFPESILRWIALSLLGVVTFVFILLSAAVLSGLTNELFLNFLDLTWPPQEALTEFEIESRRDLSFSILNYGITALGTAWVASFAYLVVMRNQQKQAEQQLSLERLKLTTDLDTQILDILEAEAVVDFASDGSLSRVRLITVLDRNTEWRPGTDRNWKYREGDRTVPFVQTSSVVSKDAEVSVTALHHYIAWIRRIARATETGVLMEKDILLFWRWIVIGCYRNRYTFLRDIFYKDDLDDFVRLADQIVRTGRTHGSGQDFVEYLRGIGDPDLIALLSDEAKAIVAPEAVAAA